MAQALRLAVILGISVTTMDMMPAQVTEASMEVDMGAVVLTKRYAPPNTRWSGRAMNKVPVGMRCLAAQLHR